MKKLSELYSILLEDFKNRNKQIDETDGIYMGVSEYSFLCNCLKQLHKEGIFNDDEFAYLYSHFILQKPSRTVNTAFYDHELYDGDYVWFKTLCYSKEAFALRVQLLTNIISKLKEESK